MIKQNGNFIQRKCRFCGGVDVGGVACSEVRLVCGYGSANDLETIEAQICGACADKLHEKLSEGKRGE